MQDMENNMHDIDKQGDILEQLKLLNIKLAKQNSLGFIFRTGIVYGVGFFIGSAILATIALGVFAPWFGQIDWIAENYQKGESLK